MPLSGKFIALGQANPRLSRIGRLERPVCAPTGGRSGKPSPESSRPAAWLTRRLIAFIGNGLYLAGRQGSNLAAFGALSWE